MYRILIVVVYTIFCPLLSFSQSKTQDYLSDLEQEITKDMDATNAISVTNNSNIKDDITLQQNSSGSFNSYFTSIPEKKHSLVDFYIQYYSTFGKKKLEESLDRLKNYFPVISKYAYQEKLPLEVAIIPLVENDAKLDYIRDTRAGMWSLPVSTAQIYGLQINDYTDERLDLEKSTQASLKHFKSLKDAFNGSWDLALTAFNGGGAYFNQKIRDLGIDNFWDLIGKDKDFGSDTLEYVPKFYALLTILKHPQTYNINVPVMNTDSVDFTSITLNKSGVAFKDIAKLTNMSIEKITTLNPQLSKQYTVKGVNLYIPANTKYLVNSRIRVAKAIHLKYLPSGRGISTTNSNISYSSTLAKKKSNKSSKNFSYKVKSKDTLFGIAKRYNISVSSLIETNNLSAGSVLSIGKVIKIPAGKKVSTRSIAKSKQKGISYTVKKGDTIYSIAKNYSVSQSKVINQNNGNIKPGDQLIILK